MSIQSFKKDVEGVPTIKLVIYGPASSGKTTLIKLYSMIKKIENSKGYTGKMASITNPFEETAFFDHNTFVLGSSSDPKKSAALKYVLYSVAGQPRYRKTREVVLQGAEGILVLLDFAKDQEEENFVILRELKENLQKQGLWGIPWVVAINKKDLPNTEKLSLDAIKNHMIQEQWPRATEDNIFEISCLDARDALIELLRTEDKNKLFDKEGRFNKSMRPVPVVELILPIYELTKQVVDRKLVDQ